MSQIETRDTGATGSCCQDAAPGCCASPLVELVETPVEAKQEDGGVTRNGCCTPAATGNAARPERAAVACC